MKINKEQLKWTREPKQYSISEDKIEIITNPHTDLWQRTYYHFRNDNAPVLQMKTSEKFFSFVVKTEFEGKVRFDQCGIVMYLDSENWLKGSIEYENEEFQHLGSVVTNNGYSDWATTEIDAGIKSMWYRFSRREDDYCIECSEDGIKYKQMRICHVYKANDEIQFGIYACSPENSSFKATFTNMELTECKWLTHDGQAPDKKQKFRFNEEVLYMKKSISRIIGVIMLIVAVIFIMFALNHPEKSFPWNNTITWLLYGVYFLVTVVLLIAPKMKK